MLKVVRHMRANVIAYLALFVALGGTSVAATGLGKNVVGSKQIKPGAVHTSDIASNAVTSAKVKNGQLRAADFRASDFASLKGATGAKGDKGDKGDAGRSALTTLASGETVRGTIGMRHDNLGAGQEFAVTASLPIPAPVALDDAHVTVDGSDEASNECTGSATNPTAAPGYVCMYPWFAGNTTGPTGHVWGSDALAAEKWGFQVSILAAAAGDSAWFANWAYTAP